METIDIENSNPGEELLNLLKEVLADPSDDVNLVKKADQIFKHDGVLLNLIHNSTLNYLLRRLINTAFYFKKKDLNDSYEYMNNIRTFLEDKTTLDPDQIEKAISAITRIFEQGNKNSPSKGTRKKLIREAKNESLSCYICGKEIDFNDSNSWEYCQVEHIWAQSLGGSNKEFNLKISCKKCNHFKKQFLDATDYHYEHIAYRSLHEQNSDQNHSEFKYEHKLAILAKNNFSCAVCGKSPSQVGPLKFKRLDENDSWHFLNIEAYCSEHFQL